MTPDPLAALFAELGRLKDLARLEVHLRCRGFSRIAGVDEAGRGSLAGPVVAAAVILPADCILPGLDDSKQVDAEARERLDREIRRCALAACVGLVEARDIDAGDIFTYGPSRTGDSPLRRRRIIEVRGRCCIDVRDTSGGDVRCQRKRARERAP